MAAHSGNLTVMHSPHINAVNANLTGVEVKKRIKRLMPKLKLNFSWFQQ
jgi:hypothetical protein